VCVYIKILDIATLVFISQDYKRPKTHKVC